MNNLSQNSQKSISKAIFLDRDGTFDYGYVSYPHKIHFIDGGKEAINIFIGKQFFLFPLTSQPGIELKIYDLEDVKACNHRIIELLGNPQITEICIAAEATYSPKKYGNSFPKFIHEMVRKYQLKPKKCLPDWRQRN